ncbi:sensor histidine kinase [Micromonospora sp. NPDC007230]|uniref:sensor histidine kinase n=1 Tax=Micromonospora sp. NPDC007230 TaxID=3364237 RepID=UPI0036C11C59
MNPRLRSMVDSSGLATGFLIASAFQAHHDTVLDTFRKRLIGACGPIDVEETLLDQAVIQARQVLADVTESIRTGQVQVDETAIALAWQADAARAMANLHPVESLRAATELFEPVLDAVIETAAGHPDATCIIRTATQALQRSVMTRVRWASEAYVGLLLDRVQQAQLAERRRTARELHDRVGGPASVVTRNLELAKTYADTDRDRSHDKVNVAYQASVQTLEAIRGVTTDLRLEFKFDNLEQALRGFLDVMGEGNATVDLAVSGDEAWVPAEVLAEVFLVAREALRNAFRHSHAHTILSHVDIAPHEIRIWVSDDGVGFDPDHGSSTGGSGLTSMRERTELLGGKLFLHSTPSRGTRIEAFIPRPEFVR